MFLETFKNDENFQQKTITTDRNFKLKNNIATTPLLSSENLTLKNITKNHFNKENFLNTIDDLIEHEKPIKTINFDNEKPEKNDGNKCERIFEYNCRLQSDGENDRKIEQEFNEKKQPNKKNKITNSKNKQTNGKCLKISSTKKLTPTMRHLYTRRGGGSDCSSIGNSSATIKSNRHFIIGGSRLKATSCLTLILFVCLETVLLSTVTNCAKTFYMHWNTSNSIFRIDNTDHIIDVNKGNLAFEFDQVHIICPVYEPGTFENETEKYIIYNVSKVEYETCRITNSDPRVIAICDKPQKLMFFTITFRPFTPQPGGLEFLPGNDYYFISTSSKDDLYRRIGGRCSTNNMKVVFKVCCAPEEQHHQNSTKLLVNSGQGGGGSGVGGDNRSGGGDGNSGGGSGGTSINTNIDQYNRIPTTSHNNHNNNNNNHNNNNDIEANNNNGFRVGGGSNGGFMATIQHVNTNISNVVQSTMSWPGWGGPGGGGGIKGSGAGGMGGQNYPQSGLQYSTPLSTSINNPAGGGGYMLQHPQIPHPPHQYYPQPPHHMMTSPRPNINSAINNNSYNTPSLSNNMNNNNNYNNNNKPTKKTNEYDKHPNEVVKNEELTYNSGGEGFLSRRGSSSNIKITIRLHHLILPFTVPYGKFQQFFFNSELWQKVMTTIKQTETDTDTILIKNTATDDYNIINNNKNNNDNNDKNNAKYLIKDNDDNYYYHKSKITINFNPILILITILVLFIQKFIISKNFSLQQLRYYSTIKDDNNPETKKTTTNDDTCQNYNKNSNKKEKTEIPELKTFDNELFVSKNYSKCQTVYKEGNDNTVNSCCSSCLCSCRRWYRRSFFRNSSSTRCRDRSIINCSKNLLNVTTEISQR